MSEMTPTDNMDMKKMNNEMMESMNGMKAKMDAMKMTGDFDLDFANMMIEHHQGAIDMSNIEVSKGADKKMKNIRFLAIALSVTMWISSCGMLSNMFKRKSGCPIDGKNVGAEQILSGDPKATKAAEKAKKFKS